MSIAAFLSRLADSQQAIRAATVDVNWECYPDGSKSYRLRSESRRAVEMQIDTMVKRAEAQGRCATFTEVYPAVPGGFGAHGTEA